jgi:hypothetical protein
MQAQLLWIMEVDLDVNYQVLIRYTAFVKHSNWGKYSQRG